MFTVICRLFLVLVFATMALGSAFTAAAQPFVRLPILRATPKRSIVKLHRPNYRPYKAYLRY